MIDMKAKGIFKEIKDLEELLKEDLEGWDRRSLPGKITQHAQARNRLAELKKEFETFVRQNAAAMFVTGDLAAVANFCKLAEEKGGTITVDGLGVYKALADGVFEALRRNPSTLVNEVDYNIIGALSNRLVALCQTLNYPGLINVRFTKLLDRPFMYKADFIEAIRQILDSDGGFGDLLNWGYIQKEIVDRAFASGLTNSPVPCVIVNAGEDKTSLINAIFGERFVDVKVEGDVVPYTVTKAFNELKKKLKSTTNQDEVSN